MNASGLLALGYRYVNMDASWNLPTRDANGNLQPNPALWPNGLETVVDYVHSKGLGFGLYGDRGTMDCAKMPGNLGHESQDAEFYASMQIDWYKSDSCYAASDPPTAFAEYGKMRDALNATGRHIWFALCGWNPWYAPVGQSLGNSWRIGVDTGGGWSNVLENVNAILTLAQYAGPTSGGGGWNDMSLLLTPGEDLLLPAGLLLPLSFPVLTTSLAYPSVSLRRHGIRRFSHDE
jgi:alpha-galactosidase